MKRGERKKYQCSHEQVAKYRFIGENRFLEAEDGVIYWYLGNATNDIARDIILNVLEQVFVEWGKALYFIDFRRTDDVDQAHIQFWFGSANHFHLGGCPFEFDGASGVLAHAFPTGSGGLSGHIHFDDDEIWTPFHLPNEDNQHISLFQVALHEVGHVLGLAHSEVEDAVMFAFYDGTKNALHEDDVLGARELYRDFEPEIEEAFPMWLKWLMKWFSSLPWQNFSFLKAKDKRERNQNDENSQS